jgi:hypothetical protein
VADIDIRAEQTQTSYMTPKMPPTSGEDPAALLERLYAPLIKQLNLTPEQSRRLCAVILDCKMNGQAQMTELLRHENLSKMTGALADIQKETDASLQALLGPSGFAQYQVYQRRIMADHYALEMMKSEFAQNPLTEKQQEQLLNAMESERNAVGESATVEVIKFSIADTSEVMAEKLSRQQRIDQQVLRQAAGFLSPAQLQILGSAQARMMTARKSGYAKARGMFGAC